MYFLPTSKKYFPIKGELKYYFLISFCTGGVLLALELLMAKLIAPYFGHSFYVWAATIGTTMLGLMVGYHLSGKLIESNFGLKKGLIYLLGGLGVYLAILPFYGSLVLGGLVEMDVIKGILISTTLLNLPLYTMFGMFSPIIIEIVQKTALSNTNTGNSSGKIYGVSTIGGVLFMLLTGIFFLPELGLKMSVFILSGLIITLFLGYFVLVKKELGKSEDKSDMNPNQLSEDK